MVKKTATLALLLAVSVLTGDNLVKNSSFEEGTKHWHVPGWVKNLTGMQTDSTVMAEGQNSLKIQGVAGKRGFVRQVVEIPAGTREITASVKIKTAGFPRRGWVASMHVGFSGKGVKARETVLGTDWKKPDNDWVSFGKIIPVPEGATKVTIGLRMHNASNYGVKPHNTGCAWFDEVNIYPGKHPALLPKPAAKKKAEQAISFIEPTKTGGVYLPGEKVTMKCTLKVKDTRAVYTIYDFFNKQVASGKLADAKKFSFNAPKKNGFYTVKVALTGKVFGEKTGSFIVAEPTPKPDRFFAMCHHYFPESYLPAARMLGYGAYTIALYRYRAEKQPGVYTFGQMDELTKKVEALGMIPHGHLAAGGYVSWSLPPWLNELNKKQLKEGYSEEYFEQTRKFIRAAVRYFGNRFESWSHSGEINLMIRHSKYMEDHYLRALKILHEEVKAFNPAMPITALAVAGVDYPNYRYLKHILPKAMPYLDNVGPDWYNTPYVYGPGHRPISEEKANLRQQILDIRKLAPGKKLSIEEKGYGYAPNMPFNHPALAENAAVAQRGMIIAKGLGLTRWLPHYGVARKEGKSYNMAMWMRNNPRPLLASTATIARLLANAHSAIEVHPTPEVWCYVFKRGDKTIAALWQSSSKPVIETSFRVPAGVTCYDIMGNVCKFENTVSNYPVFFETAENQKTFAKRIADSTFALPKYAAESQFASTGEIRLIFRNLSGKALTLKVTHPDAPAQTVKLAAPDKPQSVTFKLNKAVTTPYKSNFTVIDGKEKRTIPANLETIAVKKLARVKLDGTLKSFKGVTPIVMDNAEFLLPVDAAPNRLWTGKDDLSAKIYLGYDEKNFYIGAEITDDQWFFTKKGPMLWSQDAIEFAMDPQNNAVSGEIKAPGYDPDDLDITFGKSVDGPATQFHTAPAGTKTGARTDIIPVIKFSGKNRMILEQAIPWSEIKVTPETGRIFGFSITVFDREAAVGPNNYNMSLTRGITTGKDPSCFRKFQLK